MWLSVSASNLGPWVFNFDPYPGRADVAKQGWRLIRVSWPHAIRAGPGDQLVAGGHGRGPLAEMGRPIL